jgi:hypothetical protein
MGHVFTLAWYVLGSLFRFYQVVSFFSNKIWYEICEFYPRYNQLQKRKKYNIKEKTNLKERRQGNQLHRIRSILLPNTYCGGNPGWGGGRTRDQTKLVRIRAEVSLCYKQITSKGTQLWFSLFKQLQCSVYEKEMSDSLPNVVVWYHKICVGAIDINHFVCGRRQRQGMYPQEIVIGKFSINFKACFNFVNNHY